MKLVVRKELPRLPLDGLFDITYRCNNTCRHCWLWEHPDAPLGKEELSFTEIRHIVDEARAMGCQAWSISGGEPMLRPDFTDIFDYITRKSVHYDLNTNGTLITPEIASLMKRRGNKMVALYGATAEVHDRVTRNPGSFEATQRGFAYLKEAGADFVVQIVPMRENYHQYDLMLALAQSLSPAYRVGAPWLWLSACHSDVRNREIARQRLNPAEVISLDEPFPGRELLPAPRRGAKEQVIHACGVVGSDDRLFASCISSRREFHIDPYGQMSFCYYVKDPALRYDLRQGSFRQAWDEFIPSLADVVHGDAEFQENCGSCELSKDCRWCGVYGYLEHGRYSAKVEYLCRVAAEARKYKEDWKINNVRYFKIAGISIQVTSDFPMHEKSFTENLNSFQADGPGEDTISIHLVSAIPANSDVRLGKEVYHKVPWAIYRQRQAWVYVGTTSEEDVNDPHAMAIFDEGHNKGTIYRKEGYYTQSALPSLTTFASDQMLLARVLADRQACYLHASGFVMNGKGLLFVGHSEAGKSTTIKMLRGQGEILCDDRIIVRRWPDGIRIHGTWSHGELPDVSPAEAPLRAILFLEQALTNELIPIVDKKERLGWFLSHVVKPFATPDWWEKILLLAGNIAAEVPAYRMRFDKSGQIVDLLRNL